MLKYRMVGLAFSLFYKVYKKGDKSVDLKMKIYILLCVSLRIKWPLLLKHENIVLRLNSVPSYKVSKLVLPLPDHLHTDTRTSLRDISRFTQT